MKIWAHRGASGEAPENTLFAFQKAMEMGVSGIELDVQMTSDNQLVVCHDETINRTSDGTGFIYNQTLKELKQHDFGQGEKIPTLDEVLRLLKQYELSDFTLNIELKNSLVPYPGMEKVLVEKVYQYDFSNRVLYSSFNHASVAYIKAKIDTSAEIAFLYSDKFFNIADYCKEYDCAAVHPSLYSVFSPLCEKNIMNFMYLCSEVSFKDAKEMELK